MSKSSVSYGTPRLVHVDRTPVDCAPVDLGALGLDRWIGERRPRSSADPEVLARAVRAHKAGDAFAQAALTLVLMLAIGAVAFVLSAGRASAAAGVVQTGADQGAVLALLAVAGGAALLATRATLRRVKARIR